MTPFEDLAAVFCLIFVCVAAFVLTGFVAVFCAMLSVGMLMIFVTGWADSTELIY